MIQYQYSALPTELSSQLGAGHPVNIGLIAQFVDHCSGIPLRPEFLQAFISQLLIMSGVYN